MDIVKYSKDLEAVGEAIQECMENRAVLIHEQKLFLDSLIFCVNQEIKNQEMKVELLGTGKEGTMHITNINNLKRLIYTLESLKDKNKTNIDNVTDCIFGLFNEYDKLITSKPQLIDPLDKPCKSHDDHIDAEIRIVQDSWAVKENSVIK